MVSEEALPVGDLAETLEEVTQQLKGLSAVRERGKFVFEL